MTTLLAPPYSTGAFMQEALNQPELRQKDINHLAATQADDDTPTSSQCYYNSADVDSIHIWVSLGVVFGVPDYLVQTRREEGRGRLNLASEGTY